MEENVVLKSSEKEEILVKLRTLLVDQYKATPFVKGFFSNLVEGTALKSFVEATSLDGITASELMSLRNLLSWLKLAEAEFKSPGVINDLKKLNSTINEIVTILSPAKKVYEYIQNGVVFDIERVSVYRSLGTSPFAAGGRIFEYPVNSQMYYLSLFTADNFYFYVALNGEVAMPDAQILSVQRNHPDSARIATNSSTIREEASSLAVVSGSVSNYVNSKKAEYMASIIASMSNYLVVTGEDISSASNKIVYLFENGNDFLASGFSLLGSGQVSTALNRLSLTAQATFNGSVYFIYDSSLLSVALLRDEAERILGTTSHLGRTARATLHLV